MPSCIRSWRLAHFSRYLRVLQIPGAYGHGMLRCSLLQVSISAIVRSINNEDLLHLSAAVDVHFYSDIVPC